MHHRGLEGIDDYRVVEEAMRRSGFDVTEVVSGAARGVDRLGELWASNQAIPVQRFPAAWARYGRRAGPLRNEAMVEYAGQAADGGGLVAVWDGRSPGTRHVIDAASRQGLAVFVLRV